MVIFLFFGVLLHCVGCSFFGHSVGSFFFNKMQIVRLNTYKTVD